MSVKSTDLFSQIEEINRFRELCRNNDEIPLFLTAQWLDAVVKV